MISTMQQTDRFSWRTIWDLALRHRRTLLAAHIIAIGSALMSVPVPLFMPLMVDEVLLDKPGWLVGFLNDLLPLDWQTAVGYILATLVVTLFLRTAGQLLGVWQMRKFTGISKDVIFHMRRELLHRLQRVSMSEYELMGSGAAASHFVTDLDTVDKFVGETVSRFVVAFLTILGVAGILLWMHLGLGLFILCMNPAVIYLTIVLGRRVKHLKARENKAYEIFQGALTETLEAIQQVRAANRDGHYVGRLVRLARDVRNHGTAFAWQSDAARRVSFLVFLFGFEVFRAVSMLMVLFSDLSIGEMFAFFGYLWFMMGPVEEMLSMQYAMQSAQAALGRLNRLLSLHREPDYPQVIDPFRDRVTIGLSLDDVSFRYGDEGPRVLDGVSMDVRPGEKVALVGASGAGKTTLVQIILGLYSPDSGCVRFDGVPVEKIGLPVVRENVATVLQHPALFNDTVRNNLSLGRDVPEEELLKALEVAQLAEVVAQMPRGLETLVGRNGVRLSGGQRQRLAVARMILSRPKLVILDEATSALDNETEARLHAAMGEFLRGRTTLIIAHRLSAVRRADRVYVFDGGRVAEQGSHQELVDAQGIYARLYGGAAV